MSNLTLRGQKWREDLRALGKGGRKTSLPNGVKKGGDLAFDLLGYIHGSARQGAGWRLRFQYGVLVNIPAQSALAQDE